MHNVVLYSRLKNIVDTAIIKTGMYNYDERKASIFTENLSLEMGLTLKARGDRFKVVVFVTIMQKNVCKLGFLWDASQDH